MLFLSRPDVSFFLFNISRFCQARRFSLPQLFITQTGDPAVPRAARPSAAQGFGHISFPFFFFFRFPSPRNGTFVNKTIPGLDFADCVTNHPASAILPDVRLRCGSYVAVVFFWSAFARCPFFWRSFLFSYFLVAYPSLRLSLIFPSWFGTVPLGLAYRELHFGDVLFFLPLRLYSSLGVTHPLPCYLAIHFSLDRLTASDDARFW